MPDVVVYGASGFGQQVMFWLEGAAAVRGDLRLLGFVDDDAATHGTFRTDHEVLGGYEWLERRAAEGAMGVVMGLGTPSVKEAILARLDGLEVDFPSVVHPSSIVSRHASLGRGVLVGPANVISVGVALDELVTIHTACTIGHDARVGRCSIVLPGGNLSGGSRLGERVSMGTGAAVIQGVEIGRDTVVGAGATVVCDLPEACTAVGTPARPLAGR